MVTKRRKFHAQSCQSANSIDPFMIKECFCNVPCLTPSSTRIPAEWKDFNQIKLLRTLPNKTSETASKRLMVC